MADEEGRPPVLDGRRAFYGRPQLTDYENQILGRIAVAGPLFAICERKVKAFYVGQTKVRASTVKRLIERRYLRPLDPGLLSEDELMAQTYEVTPYEQEMSPPSCCDKGEPEIIEKDMQSCEQIETVHKKSTLHTAMVHRLRPKPSST